MEEPENQTCHETFDPRNYQQSEQTIQTVTPLFRGTWRKKNPDYSAYVDRYTQRELGAACRARQLSSCGSKLQLSRRLRTVGVPAAEVLKVAKEGDWRGDGRIKKFESLPEQGNADKSDSGEATDPDITETQGAGDLLAGEDDETQPPPREPEIQIDATVEALPLVPSAKKSRRSPNFTAHEQCRLSHIMADPRMSFTLGKMYNRPKSRAEIDAWQESPWDSTIRDMFNNNELIYQRVRPVGDVLEPFIESIDPNDHPYERTGALLKAKWSKMRSHFTVVYSRWSASGQNDASNFPKFVTDGSIVLIYVFCVFYKLPSLSLVLTTIPEEARLEEGMGAAARSVKRKKSVKSKESEAAFLSMAEKVGRAADRIGQAGIISMPKDREIMESRAITEQATAYKSLLSLESEILGFLEKHPADPDKVKALDGVQARMRSLF